LGIVVNPLRGTVQENGATVVGPNTTFDRSLAFSAAVPPRIENIAMHANKILAFFISMILKK